MFILSTFKDRTFEHHFYPMVMLLTIISYCFYSCQTTQVTFTLAFVYLLPTFLPPSLGPGFCVWGQKMRQMLSRRPETWCSHPSISLSLWGSVTGQRVSDTWIWGFALFLRVCSFSVRWGSVLPLCTMSSLAPGLQEVLEKLGSPI